jgi:hypothetical protein
MMIEPASLAVELLTKPDPALGLTIRYCTRSVIWMRFFGKILGEANYCEPGIPASVT